MTTQDGDLVRRLRAAGCVFAEDEARLLLEATSGGADLEALVRRREAGEPLETVVGHVDLAGLRLSVGPGVFVPRQRSVLLANIADRAAAQQDPPVVVEAFCGVAPIAAVVLASLPTAECHVTDHDPVALHHARRNLPPHAEVHLGTGLAALPPSLRGRVAVLAAVPPYVPADAVGLLPREARDHEPATALLGGSDGLDHVRRLVDEAGEWLRPGGRLLVELHRAQLPEAARLGEKASYDVRSHAGDDGHTVVLDLARPA